jgi:L-fuculose-phosphate aldolase
MYQKRWVANHDGNISQKVQSNLLLATPTAMSKIEIQAEDILGLNGAGEKVFGSRAIFSEINLHLAAYQTRTDISAVVHAHPPYATAFSICRLPITEPTMPEVVVSLGSEIPVTQYALPGEAAAQAVAEKIGNSNALILAGNGVLTVGRTVEEAFLRMELAEHFAQINFLAKSLSAKCVLSAADIALLLEKREKAGMAPPDQTKNVFEKSLGGNVSTCVDETLKKIIAEEVARALGA